MKMNDPLFLVGILVALAIAFVLGYEFSEYRFKPIVHHFQPPPH